MYHLQWRTEINKIRLDMNETKAKYVVVAKKTNLHIGMETYRVY